MIRIESQNHDAHGEFAAPLHARHAWFIRIVSDTQRLPMNSPPAPPTSIPSISLISGDHALIDARIWTRQDTTEGFSVGLIPQLIDVLQVLTDGQDLLLRRIRAARLGESSHSVSHVEPLEGLQVDVGQSRPDAEVDVGGRHRAPSQEMNVDEDAVQAGSNGVGYARDRGVAVGRAHAADAHADARQPPLPAEPRPTPKPDTVSDPSDRPAALSIRADGLPPNETAEEALRRNYNFFDELDAKLASLRDLTA
jgi:hypothetical protein